MKSKTSNVIQHLDDSPATTKRLINSMASHKTLKWRFTAATLVVFVVLHFIAIGSGIPETIDGWRVEVGPPGNEFYDPSAPRPGGL